MIIRWLKVNGCLGELSLCCTPCSPSMLPSLSYFIDFAHVTFSPWHAHAFSFDSCHPSSPIWEAILLKTLSLTCAYSGPWKIMEGYEWSAFICISIGSDIVSTSKCCSTFGSSWSNSLPFPKFQRIKWDIKRLTKELIFHSLLMKNYEWPWKLFKSHQKTDEERPALLQTPVENNICMILSDQSKT